MYNVVFHGIVVLRNVSYDEVKKEIELLFRHYKLTGETAAIVSPATGKIVDVYYLDKDGLVDHIPIN